MNSVLVTEGEVADYLVPKFRKLAETVRNSSADPKLLKTAREQVDSFRRTIISERQQLIKQEIELYSIV